MMQCRHLSSGLRAAVLAGLCTFVPGASDAQRAAHWEAALRRGPNAVGLDTLQLRDSQRTFRFEGGDSGRSGARPVRLLIWRPAASRSRSALTFGHYAELVGFEARERVDSPPTAAARELKKQLNPDV